MENRSLFVSVFQKGLGPSFAFEVQVSPKLMAQIYFCAAALLPAAENLSEVNKFHLMRPNSSPKP